MPLKCFALTHPPLMTIKRPRRPTGVVLPKSTGHKQTVWFWPRICMLKPGVLGTNCDLPKRSPHIAKGNEMKKIISKKQNSSLGFGHVRFWYHFFWAKQHHLNHPSEYQHPLQRSCLALEAKKPTNAPRPTFQPPNCLAEEQSGGV